MSNPLNALKSIFLALVCLLIGLTETVGAASNWHLKNASGDFAHIPVFDVSFEDFRTLDLYRENSLPPPRIGEDVQYGPNEYTYVRQNPWTMYDPHGLWGIGDSNGAFIDSLWNGAASAGHNTLYKMGELEENHNISGKAFTGAAVAGVVATGGTVLAAGSVKAGAVVLAKEGASEVIERTTGVPTSVKDIPKLAKNGAKGLAKTLSKKGDDVSEVGAKSAKTIQTESSNNGVIYKRTDATGEIEPYIGQAKNESRFISRQSEHARKHPDADFEFEVVGRANPGTDLDVLEHTKIQELTGGVAARKSSKVSNKKDPVGKKRRQKMNLPEPKLTE